MLTTTSEMFMTALDGYCRHHPTLRYGQCVMNVLYSMNPDLHKRVCDEKLDVFYSTDMEEIGTLLAWISLRLHD